MSDSFIDREDMDPRVRAALAEYLECLDRGERVDRERFLVEHADVADAVRSFIANSDELARWARENSSSRSTQSAARRASETVPPRRARASAKPFDNLPLDFGRYRVLKRLGRGAMGAVYLAEDLQLERHVALKIPAVDHDPAGELLTRFFREAKSAATLRHPNICPVYDVGEVEGQHYISMAYIDGHSLAELIKSSSPPTERQSLNLIRKLALSLHEAHRQKIVHRDLKPANVMIDARGEPIVMDFGLACRVESTDVARLTHSGTIVGSPAYMSPEQVDGNPDDITPAADQYSLGVMLYELLTGKLPFHGTLTAVLAQIAAKTPAAPRTIRSEIDPRAEAICLKMMAKSAANRYPSLEVVAAELLRVLREPKPAATDSDPAVSSSMAVRLSLSERQKLIQELIREGDLTGAEEALTALAALTDARSQKAAEWARQQLTKLKADARRWKVDVPRLEELARQLLRKHEYADAANLLEQVPASYRSPKLEELCERAEFKQEECDLLLVDIERAIRKNHPRELPGYVMQFLKLKPGHTGIKRIASDLEKYGPERVILVRRGEKDFLDPAGQVWNVKHIALALAGILVLIIAIYESTIAYRTSEDIANNPPQDPSTPSLPVPPSPITATRPDQPQSPNSKLTKSTAPLGLSNGTLATLTRTPPLIAKAPFDAAQARKHQQAWAEFLDVPVEFTSSGGIRFRLIPPGETLIDSKQPSLLTVPEAVYLGVTELTRGQYANLTGYALSASNGDLPQTSMSIEECFDFCNRLSKAEDLAEAYRRASDFWVLSSYAGFRIAGRDEAEFAALAGKAGDWRPSPSEWNEIAWYSENSASQIHEVAQKTPNPFGLYDLYGNVWEWCDISLLAAVCRGYYYGKPQAALRGFSETFTHGRDYKAYDLGVRLALTVTDETAKYARLRTSAQQSDSFVPLFNGADLSGWDGDKTGWSVRDGAIVSLSSLPKLTYIHTTASYRDFELRMQFRAFNGVAAGVHFRTVLDAAGAPAGRGVNVGFARQTIADGSSQLVSRSGLVYYHGKSEYAGPITTNLVAVNRPAESENYAAASWTSLVIRCVGRRETIAVNGVVTSDLTYAELGQRGRIGLEVSGGTTGSQIEFRDIRICNLDEGGDQRTDTIFHAFREPSTDAIELTTASAVQSVMAGDDIKVAVQIKRSERSGAILIEPKSVPAGILIPRVSIPTDVDECDLVVSTKPSLAPGKYDIDLSVTGERQRSQTTVSVVVLARNPSHGLLIAAGDWSRRSLAPKTGWNHGRRDYFARMCSDNTVRFQRLGATEYAIEIDLSISGESGAFFRLVGDGPILELFVKKDSRKRCVRCQLWQADKGTYPLRSEVTLANASRHYLKILVLKSKQWLFSDNEMIQSCNAPEFEPEFEIASLKDTDVTVYRCSIRKPTEAELSLARR